VKTVFASGVFDLLHPGHVEFLRWARSLGDRLAVSVAADATAEIYKRRPVQSAEDRRAMLSALRAVDSAVIAPVSDRPWADCIPVILDVMPQIWALGPDDPRADVKRLWATERGIAVVQQDAPKPYSTTALIERAQRVATRERVLSA
jgi:FAD synthetase